MKNKLELCVFKNEYTSSQMCSERVTAISFCEDDDGYAVTEDVDYNIMYPSDYLLKNEFGSYAFTAEDYIKVLKLGMKLGQLGYNDISVKNIKERYDM